MGMRELLGDPVGFYLFRTMDQSGDGTCMIVGQRIQIITAIEPVIRMPSLRAAPIAKIIRSIQMPFTHVARHKPLLLKSLPNRRKVGVGSLIIPQDASRMGIQPCHNRGSRGAAHR